MSVNNKPKYQAFTPRNDVDWGALERDYRSGQFSNFALGRKYGCAESTVRYKAKKHGWVNDIAKDVRKLANNVLSSEWVEPDPDDIAGSFAPLGKDAANVASKASRKRSRVVPDSSNESGIEEQGESPDDAVLRGAATHIAIIKRHRVIIRRLRKINDELIAEFEEMIRTGQAEGKELKTDKLNKLIAATERLIMLERRAFNIEDDQKEDAALTINVVNNPNVDA